GGTRGQGGAGEIGVAGDYGGALAGCLVQRLQDRALHRQGRGHFGEGEVLTAEIGLLVCRRPVVGDELVDRLVGQFQRRGIEEIAGAGGKRDVAILVGDDENL